jgi:undecaprenyl-diphosphatase
MGRHPYLVVLFGLIILVLAFYFSYRWVATHRRLLVAYTVAVQSYPPVAQLITRHERQVRWLLRRLSPGGYLGLHLTLGLLAAGGCLWLFGGLAEDLLSNDPLVRFDEALATYLHNLATPPLTTFFVVITALGSLETIAGVGLFVAGFFVWRRWWLPLVTWLAAVAGGVALNQLLKGLFARPRPSLAEPLLPESGYSFPSGHAMQSLILYELLAYFAVLALRSWRAKTAVVFGLALLVILIGFSRLYLGVHYFSDVVAGFAAGGVWLSAVITGTEVVRRGEHRANQS